MQERHCEDLFFMLSVLLGKMLNQPPEQERKEKVAKY